jgi:hypothetical protein
VLACFHVGSSISTRPAARGGLLPQVGGTLRADLEGAARDRRRSRSGRSRPEKAVGGLDCDRGSTAGARQRRDRRGNFPPCKALKTHKTAKESRFRASRALPLAMASNGEAAINDPWFEPLGRGSPARDRATTAARQTARFPPGCARHRSAKATSRPEALM